MQLLTFNNLNTVGGNITDGNVSVTGKKQGIEADGDLDVGYIIEDIIVKSTDGTVYSEIPTNGNFELIVAINGICSDESDILPAKFIVSTYDSAERLISIETKEITEQMIQNGEIAISVDSSVKPISKLKIFIWDSINNMKPLADSIILPNKQ